MNIDHIAIPIILIGSLIIAVFFCLKANKTNEGFAQTLGTLENQRRYYARCTNDCHRNHEALFHDNFSGMELLCHQKCAITAENRSRRNAPDLTPSEFQRHTSVLKESIDPEFEYCMADIKEKCDINDCVFSKNQESCKNACFRVNKYKCFSGLSYSAAP